MTESYAEKYGLTPNDINQVNMEYASAYQHLQQAKVMQWRQIHHILTS